jgi:hypothetical protein
MGPLHSKINTAPVRSSYSSFDKPPPNFTIEKSITSLLLFIIIFYLQNCYSMETGSGSTLTPEEAARLGDETAAAAAASDAAAAAAAAAASIRMKFLAEKNSGNISLPASSGVVQTATPPIPPSERSKLIRINRELQNKPIVLGGGLSNLSAGHGKLPLSGGWPTQ